MGPIVLQYSRNRLYLKNESSSDAHIRNVTIHDSDGLIGGIHDLNGKADIPAHYEQAFPLSNADDMAKCGEAYVCIEYIINDIQYSSEVRIPNYPE